MTAFDPRDIHVASVLVSGKVAARLRRTTTGIQFEYLPDYLASGEPAVATMLPLSQEPSYTTSGALPPFFAGLLPEGRRLSALKRYVKTSADDEFSLLLAVGVSTVGNIDVIPEGAIVKQPEPVIDATNRQLDFTDVLNSSGIVDTISLAGIQDKASARTIAIPVQGRSTTDAILKISPPEFPNVVENEAVCLQLARDARGVRLPVADTTVMHDIHGRAGLLVSRFDRVGEQRFAVEDAAQLLKLYPADKYSPSFEEVSLAVAKVCAAPMLAKRSVAFQLAFAWLTGNGDLHAKNISVINRGTGFELSPIYDIPSTIPYGDTTLALPVQGKRDGLSRKRFLAYTDEIGLPPNVAQRVAASALVATESAAERIIAACDFDPRRARDLRRVLAKRRSMWD